MRHARKQLHRNPLRQVFNLTLRGPFCQNLPLSRILFHINPKRPGLSAAAKLQIHNLKMMRRRNPLRQRPNFIHLQCHKSLTCLSF